MAAAAKPSAKGAVGAITRKIGPLPLWAWFVAALAAYYLYTKVSGGGSASTATTTNSSGTPSAATTDASGNVGSGSTSTDNMNSDLLSALLQGQAQSEQSLLDALNTVTYYASGAYGGYGGAAPGSVSTSGAATQTVAAAEPTPAAATTPAPTPPAATQPQQPVSYTYTEPVGSASLSPAPDVQWLGAAAPTPEGTAAGSYYGTLSPYNPTGNSPVAQSNAALTANSQRQLTFQ